MSYLLEVLGRGLLAELGAAFTQCLRDDGHCSTNELEWCAAEEPEKIEHHRRLALHLLAEKQLARAKEAFQAALQCDPNDRASRVGLACTLDELGHTRDAIRELRQGLERDPADGPAWFALGFCLEKIGETHEAIVAYESTLDIEPKLRNPHERLAAIYLKLDNVEMAIAHYEHLCWCEPADIEATLILANLYVRARRFEDAIRRYQHAIQVE